MRLCLQWQAWAASLLCHGVDTSPGDEREAGGEGVVGLYRERREINFSLSGSSLQGLAERTDGQPLSTTRS